MFTINIVDCPSNVRESEKFAAAEAVADYLADYDLDLLWDMAKDMFALLEQDDSRAVNGNTAWQRIQAECDRIVWSSLGVYDWHGFKNGYNGSFPRAEIWIYGNCC